MTAVWGTVASAADGAAAPDSVEVATRDGVLAGERGAVLAFRGIPFAAPPVGPLRWKPPQPVAGWSGVRPAIAFGPDAMQHTRRRPVSEDCLYLNVWTPTLQPSRPLPVMVWIHGGGFTDGAGSVPMFDGAGFAGRGVVLVTINYRLGLFGFLAHPGLTQESPDRVSGNYGLQDQIAALRWVQDNIARFGGDPDCVTVFGQSAGAYSVSLLLTSPWAEGLFHRAILQSPGSLRPLPTLAEAEQAGAALECDVERLRAMTAGEILELQARLMAAQEPALLQPRPLGPVHDGRIVPWPDEGVAATHGRLRAVDTVIGTCADEGVGFVKGWAIDDQKAYGEFLRRQFGPRVREVFAHYPVRRDREVKVALAAFHGDLHYLHGTRVMARALAGGEAQVFRYHFVRHWQGGEAAPTHGDEIAYVFGHLAQESQGPQGFAGDKTRDDELSEAMQAAWVRFATTGNPNGGGLPHWPSVGAEGDLYLEIGDAVRAAAGLRAEKVAFCGGLRRWRGPELSDASP